VCAVFAPAVVALLTGGGPSPPDATVVAYFATKAIVQQQDGLAVRVRALSADESRRFFGASIAGLGVPAIWIQVQNDSDDAVRNVPILTDPNYLPRRKSPSSYMDGSPAPPITFSMPSSNVAQCGSTCLRIRLNPGLSIPTRTAA